MPKLLDVCDEAAVAHWEIKDQTIPPPTEAAVRMKDEGRISKVRHPSAAHFARMTWPDGKVPVRGPQLSP